MLGIPERPNEISRWKSEDPQLLGDLMNEIRGELDQESKPSKFGNKKEGGDPKILDGPIEYVYQHLPHMRHYPNHQFKIPPHHNTNSIQNMPV